MATATDSDYDVVLRFRLQEAGVPRRYWGGFASYEDLTPQHADLKRRAAEWSEGFTRQTERGLAMVGKTGVGKTHLAAAIAKRLVERGFKVRWYNVADLFMAIRATWGPDAKEDENDLIEDMALADLLILDDLGVERPQGWTLERLYAANRFNQIQRVAKVFAESDMVPVHYRRKMADCIIAAQLACRRSPKHYRGLADGAARH